MSEIEDLLNTKSQIKYCKRSVWSGLNPGKYEPIPGLNKTKFGRWSENLENDQLNALRSETRTMEQKPLIESLKNDIHDYSKGYAIEAMAFESFLLHLRVFRAGIRMQKKGGMLRKNLILCLCWMTEIEKGYFTESDLITITGSKKVSYYIQYFLIGGKITEHRKTKQKRSKPFFLLSSSWKASALRAWVQGLGATYRKPPFFLTPDLIRTIRNQCQMSLEEFAREIGLTKGHLYKIELGYYSTSAETNAIILDKFYYLLPFTWWPQYIREEVKEGKRPYHGNELHLSRLGSNSTLEIVRNAYIELLRIKAKNKD